MKLHELLFLTFIVTLATPMFAKVTHATSDGNWSSSGTWSNGVPACGDTIYIDKDIVVDVDIQVNLDETSACSTAIYLEISGTLKFDGGKKMYLSCNSKVFVTADGELKKGPGGGSANLIDICQTTVWQAGDGDQSGPTPIGPGLPIELISFRAVPFLDLVELTWTTASEINNDYFTVERSIDLQSFQEVTRIAGAGDSRDFLDYKTFDLNPMEGLSYYRLRQTDFNGQYSFSNIIAVDRAMNRKMNSIFPTLVSDDLVSFHLESGIQDVQVQIFTPDGKLVYRQVVQRQLDNELYTIDLSALSYYGFAVMTVNAGEHYLTSKLFIEAN